MITFPKTTYRFSAYSFDNTTEDSSEVNVEFTTQEETLSEMCEKFASFLRATGFDYVAEIDWKSWSEVDKDVNSTDPFAQSDYGEQPLTYSVAPQEDEMWGDVTVTFGDFSK
jgi:hypothetical protein